MEALNMNEMVLLEGGTTNRTCMIAAVATVACVFGGVAAFAGAVLASAAMGCYDG